MLMRVRGGQLAAIRWHLALITLSFADPANAFFASGSDSRVFWVVTRRADQARVEDEIERVRVDTRPRRLDGGARGC